MVLTRLIQVVNWVNRLCVETLHQVFQVTEMPLAASAAINNALLWKLDWQLNIYLYLWCNLFIWRIQMCPKCIDQKLKS